jgi:acyl-ACP thioesterase
VRLRTYFQSEGKVGARRDWTLTDPATGEAFGCATSSWVMFNYKTRRLGRMPEAISIEYKTLMPDPPEHTIDTAETRLKLPDMPAANNGNGNGNGAGVVRRTHIAKALDMDMNAHVNNTAFLTWVLHSLPDELQLSGLVAQYEVDYKAEIVTGAAPASVPSRRVCWSTHACTCAVQCRGAHRVVVLCQPIPSANAHSYRGQLNTRCGAGDEVTVTTCELEDAKPVPGVPASCRQFLTSVSKQQGEKQVEVLRARICWQPE